MFDIVNIVFRLLEIFILVRIVLSWIPVPVNNITRPILNFIYDITEPILRLVRNIIPPITIGGMGWDLSPILAMLLLGIVHSLVNATLALFIR
ncbi:MAG: YggT family protein [Firmicutes bacterium]|nr:YggT family protein [Bacillota bacterium]